MARPVYLAAFACTLPTLIGCGPTTDPNDPECGTQDVMTEAALVVGIDGPSCALCPNDAELFIAATLSTECGPVEWQTFSTCLVASVRATRASDGQVTLLDQWLCGDSITNWRVAPGEDLTIYTPSMADVFGTMPVPAGTYVFEVEFPVNLELEPAAIETTLEMP